jgi:hypothetical protein
MYTHTYVQVVHAAALLLAVANLAAALLLVVHRAAYLRVSPSKEGKQPWDPAAAPAAAAAAQARSGTQRVQTW